MRLLPSIHEAERRSPGSVSIANCENCLKTVNKQARQSMGCAYEAPAPSTIGVMTWDHPSHGYHRDEHDEDGKPLADVCPGYLTALPEVIDIARAHLHATTMGGLISYCDGYASPEMKIGVEIFGGARNAVECWAMANPIKGGS